MFYIFPFDSVSGALYPHPYYGTEQTLSNPPSGWSLLIALSDTDATAQAAFSACMQGQQQAYLVQNGALVDNPAWPEQQLAQAMQAQIATIEAGMNATLAGGFTAKTLVAAATTPHRYPTDTSAQANFTGIVAAFTANQNKTTATILTLDAGWVSHTKAEFFGVYSDGDAWKEAQYPQLSALVAQVNAATTVVDVQSVKWTEATY